MGSSAPFFLRSATGLVREWSSYDAWIYSFLSVNLVTLGFYIWTFNSFIPLGNPILATLIAMIFLTLQNVVYATLISSMPRVGGDYIWQSRILGGFWGFFLSWPGWVFILWLWVPLYGNMISWLLASPLSALTGNISAARWWSSPDGQFISSLIVIAFAFFYVAVGMRWYARIQKALFYVALIGMILFLIPLSTVDPKGFSNIFNSYMNKWLPNEGITYEGIIDTALHDPNFGVGEFAGLISLNFGPSFALIPMLLFWLMWPVWGATLFGEVRGAGNLKKVFWVFQWALLAGGFGAIALWILFSKSLDWTFYNSINYLYYVGSGDLQWLSSPTFLAGILTSPPLSTLMVILMSAWFFSWSGTVFLSSTRVIFASAFDRAFAKAFADVKFRFNTPINALLLMAIPSVPITILFFYLPGFKTLTLDATFAIAIAYFGSTIACMLFPFRRPQLFNMNPLSKYKVGPIPLISILSGIYAIFLLYIFWLWAVDPIYGINDPRSAVFMIGLYILAAILYISFKSYRKREGIDLSRIYQEIPVE